MLYNSSGKAKLSRTGAFEMWLQNHIPLTKAMGTVLLALPFLLLPLKDGLGVGMLTAFLLLMTAAGLTVAVAPFYYLRIKHIAILVTGCCFLEYLFS